jgi:hypothetical protein
MPVRHCTSKNQSLSLQNGVAIVSKQGGVIDSSQVCIRWAIHRKTIGFGIVNLQKR